MRKKRDLELAGALGHLPADKRVEILRRVGEVGSISQAARDAGVSYKAAWQALDTLSNLAGAALVQRSVGGAGGGGALLTEAGARLLRAADELAQARAAALARLARGGAASPLAALGLRTSMRNQLPCRVLALRGQAGLVRVELALGDGQSLAARITRESAQLLALRAGQPVLALFKATAVAITAQAGPAPGRNRLQGRISRASRAAGGGEFALALPAGLQLVGFAEGGSGLRLRGEAVASLDEAAVVIALAQ
jgi:molybdate transport system regulatory protein